MSDLLKFTVESHKLVQNNIDEFRSDFSKETYNQHQLVMLNLIRIKCDWTYRETADYVSLMDAIKNELNLEFVPHFTTIQKAHERLSLSIYRLLMKKTVQHFQLDGFSGIDATGFARFCSSRYYTQRTKMSLNAIKTTIMADLDQQVIIDLHLTTTRKHDTQISPQLLKKHPEISALAGDKGYDDSGFRKKLRSQNIRPIIRHREHKSYDRAANARIKDEDYYQRNKVETIFSVLKRKYGEQIRAKKWYLQFREMAARAVVYNLEKLIEDNYIFWKLNSSYFYLKRAA